MSSYDSDVFQAKRQVTEMLMNVVSTDERKHAFGVEQLAGAVDRLNEAWDAMTDMLVRQRDERDRVISRLISELAEAKK